MFCLFFCCSLVYMHIMFPRKIIVLLLLECLFLFCFFCLFTLSVSSGSFFFFPLFLLVLFLVLDSVVGITLMLSVGRVSGSHSSWFM